MKHGLDRLISYGHFNSSSSSFIQIQKSTEDNKANGHSLKILGPPSSLLSLTPLRTSGFSYTLKLCLSPLPCLLHPLYNFSYFLTVNDPKIYIQQVLPS